MKRNIAILFLAAALVGLAGLVYLLTIYRPAEGPPPEAEIRQGEKTTGAAVRGFPART